MVRGAIAGALKKKLGLEVTSEKVEGRYHINLFAAKGNRQAASAKEL